LGVTLETAVLNLVKLLPESLRYKALFRMGISVVPMIRYLRPRLVELSPDRAVVRINLSRRSKNAYNSLFIGAFSTGSDCVAGLFPMKYMFETGHRTIPIMKSATAEYYKRVNSYAHFTCTQGLEIYDLCNQVVASGQRLELPITVTVTAPAEHGDEPVARITQVLSLKNLGVGQ
jgi:hypothetical protein